MLVIVRCCGAVRRNCHTPDGEMERGEQCRVREQRQQSERSRGIAPSTQSDRRRPRPIDWFHGFFGPMGIAKKSRPHSRDSNCVESANAAASDLVFCCAMTKKQKLRSLVSGAGPEAI